MVAGGICAAMFRGTLGVFFGPVGILTVMAPYLALVWSAARQRALAVAAVSIGTMVVWMLRGSGEASFAEAAACGVVLCAYLFALAAVGVLLERVVGAAGAAGLSVVVGVVWLSWPFWMAPWLSGERGEEIVALLVAGHPLFVFNGQLAAFAPWAQHPIAYQLTNIGDDIAYAMPRGVWVSAAVHGSVAGVGWGWLIWAWWRDKSRLRRRVG